MTKDEINEIASRAAVPPKDAFKVLGVSPSTGYAAIRTGDIKTVKIGKKHIVPGAWLRKTLLLDPEN